MTDLRPPRSPAPRSPPGQRHHRHPWERFSHPAWLGLWFITLASESLRRFSWSESSLPLRYADECALIALLPIVYTGLVRGARDRLARQLAGLVAIWLGTGLLGALVHPWNPQATIYQLLLDTRIPLLVALGYGVRWSESADRTFRRAVLLVCAVSLASATFQWTAPDAYDQTFDAAANHTYLDRALLPRANGVFYHPAALGFFSGAATLLFLVEASTVGSVGDLVAAALASIGLLVSMQRQEAAAVLVVAPLIPWVAGSRHRLLSALASAAIFLVGVGGVGWVYGRHIQSVGTTLLGTGGDFREAARTYMYATGFRLAQQNFPLGAGLGTFGGHAAVVYDSPVFFSTGATRVWWYADGHCLTDTFWPMPIAESGWLGTAALAAFHFLLIVPPLRRARGRPPREARVLLRAFAMALYGTIVSATAPVQVTSLGGLWMFSFLGMAPRSEP